MTLRPKRNINPATGEFEDPLSNYEPIVYDDQLERSLAEETVQSMQIRPFSCVPPETTVEACVKLMVELNIACLMVAQDGKLLGIFSERDVLEQATQACDEMRNRPVSEVMTPDPVVVYETDSPAKALNLMATGGFRHVPIVDVDRNIVGILGPRRVTKYLQKYFPKQSA